MRPLNICIVSQEYPPETGQGGIATQSALKARGLSSRGHHVHVLSMTYAGKQTIDHEGDVVVHRIPHPPLPNPGYDPSSSWLAYSAGISLKLHELTKSYPFDIYQFPEYAGEGFIWQTDTFAHRPGRYVVQLHGPLAMLTEHAGWPESDSTAAQIGSFMEQMVMRNADLLLASSHNTARYCANCYGCEVERIQVVHSGVDTKRFAPMPRPKGRGSFRILFTGKLVSPKGFEAVVQSTLDLRQQIPGIQLRAIGRGDEPLIARVQDKIRQAGAEDCIQILGQVRHEELPQHFAWCDVFAGPSIFEPGPGNVYLEAMACGRAVIACNSGGAPEVVLAGKTGLLVAPGDQSQLTDAIHRLAKDPELRQRLEKAGRDWACLEFSEERYLDKVERAYFELAERQT